MRICAICSVPFPWTAVIDGKLRKLTNRKTCLQCSPFGKHNTTPLKYRNNLESRARRDNSGGIPKERKCLECNKIFIYRNNQNHKLDKCNSCVVRKRRSDLKIWAIQLLGGKCFKCAYDKCSKALEFHHKDPRTKSFNISHAYRYSRKKAEEEIKKCLLLCANCHRELDE